MMIRLYRNPWPIRFLGILPALLVSAGLVSADTTIAEWRFEGSAYDMGNDTSGNGHHLVDESYTTQYSSTEFAPGTGSTGSAYFDGASYLASLSAIDLSAYAGQNLRLDFWMKNETAQDANEYGGLGTILEVGSNFKNNLGGMYVGVNGTYADAADCGMAGMMMPGDTNTDQLPHNVFTGANSEWEHFTIEFRPNATDPAEVTQIYRNGTLVADTVVNGDHQTNYAPSKFNSAPLYLGMRKALPQYAFTGKLDDLQIYDASSGDLLGEWLFEDDAFLSDTSGNGNDLAISGTYTGVASSTDVMTGFSGTCASFDGSGMMAVGELDLSEYDSITLKYRVKNETDDILGIFLEHTANAYANVGGFVCTVQEVDGSGAAGVQLSPGAKTDRNIEATHVTQGDWIEYEITIDQTAENYEDVVTVIKNGALQPNDTPIEDRRGVLTQPESPMPYPNDLFYLGARAGSILNFIGYIDEMTLTAFEESTEPGLPGDLNNDGMVGSGDLDIVRAHWGESVTPGEWSVGDPSGDGSVGSADLDIVRANWGASSPASVPEPGGVLLVVCGMVCLARRMRRR